MKKLNSFPLVAVGCLLTLFLFTGVECNEDDPNNPAEPHCLNFRSYKVTWRPTPIDNMDRPLTPKEHFLDGGLGKALFSYQIKEYGSIVCLKEATVVDFYITIETEFFNEFLFIDEIKLNGKEHDVEWTYSESGELTSAHAGITIGGEQEGTSGGYSLAVLFYAPFRPDIESTYAFVNNVVHEITIDWAYTEW